MDVEYDRPSGLFDRDERVRQQVTAERLADVFVTYDQNLTGLRGLSMPRTTFPPARSNSGFQTVCKWRMDVSAVAGGQAVKLH